MRAEDLVLPPVPQPLTPQVSDSGELTALLRRLTELVAAFEAAVQDSGHRVVDALSEQLAQGQVATLHELHVASAELKQTTRRSVEAAGAPVRDAVQLLRDLQGATVEIGQAAGAAAARVTDALTEDMASHLSGLAQVLAAAAASGATETTRRISDQLTSDTSALGARLQDQLASAVLTATRELTEAADRTAARSTEAAAGLQNEVQLRGEELQAHLQQTRSTVQEVADTATAWTDEVRQTMEWAAGELDARVDAAALMLREEVALARASLATEREVLVAELATVAEQAIVQFRDEGTALQRSATRTFGAAAEKLADLRDEVARLTEQQARRDARQEARSDQRLTQLIERTEASVGQLLASLGQEAGRLAERDAILEQTRVDEFVRALDDVLQRAGRGRRGLRDRVRDSLNEDRRAVGDKQEDA